ncbi:hypothetical protein SERVES_01123 [Serratia ficaria]|uniref:hypothetical protein n=1 Tax=Serratia ficaria TaxID=61651 RepID=UPI00119BA70E|nr:hypothetical protein [Serratia ficaria]CAI2457835.1 Uncharacterised protein [Serratia ficaria]VVA47413.1 hypothetical protein SERVES_01123 [Serratia ficaria]
MTMAIYYTISIIIAAALVGIKLKYRMRDKSAGALILAVVAFLTGCYQFIIFANGEVMWFPETQSWINDNLIVRISALLFAFTHIFATFEFKSQKNR